VFRRMLKWVAAAIGLCVVSVALLFVATWFDHKSATILPTPTGPLSLRRVMDYWTSG
jgi:hypothetical protein